MGNCWAVGLPTTCDKEIGTGYNVPPNLLNKASYAASSPTAPDEIQLEVIVRGLIASLESDYVRVCRWSWKFVPTRSVGEPIPAWLLVFFRLSVYTEKVDFEWDPAKAESRLLKAE